MDKKDHREKSLNGTAAAAARGRKPGRPVKVTDAAIRKVMHLGTAEGARRVGLSKPQFIARRNRLEIARRKRIEDAKS